MNALPKYFEVLRVVAEDIEPVRNAQLAAMIVYKGRIISIGYNQKKTHPMAAKFGKNPDAIFLHAEVDAIVKAKKKLSDAELKKSTLIVLRVKEDNEGNKMFGIAKPCPGCSKCIEAHEIKKVIYTENSMQNELVYVTKERLK